MEWFRFYNSVLRDPKAQGLPGPLFKHWVNVLCVASENSVRGSLPPIRDIAFQLRVKPGAAIKILNQLGSVGLLDKLDDDTIVVHGWSNRQRESDDVSTRVRNFRTRGVNVASKDLRDRDVTSTRGRLENDASSDGNNAKCNVTRNVTVTPSDTEAEQSRAEAERKPLRTRNADGVMVDAPPDVVALLIDQKVPEGRAAKLAVNHPRSLIEKQIAYLAYRNASNPVGLLISSIEQDLPPPHGYSPPIEPRYSSAPIPPPMTSPSELGL